MAITTTTTWGRTLRKKDVAVIKAQLAAMNVAIGYTVDFTQDPTVIEWADVDSAVAWAQWLESGQVSPGPRDARIRLP